MESMEKAVVCVILGFFSMVALCVLFCQTETVLQNAQDMRAVTRMVEHGATPMEARCAVAPVDPFCTVLASKK